MSYNAEITSYFKKQAKRLLKKYPSLKNELSVLIDSIETDPQQGTPIGNDCYKIRISIASKNKGKSGGGRVIIHVQVLRKTAFLLSVYDKAEQENLSENELKELLKLIP